MILAFYMAAAVIMAVGSLYFAWRNRNFRKFLAGALSNAFDNAAPARCAAPLEQHADLQAVQPHPFLQFDQLEL